MTKLKGMTKLVRMPITYAMLIGLALLYGFPFLFVILNSLKEKIAILKNPLALPSGLAIQNYLDAFDLMHFGTAFINSVVVTAGSLFVLTVFPAMLAYYIDRSKTRFAETVFYVLVGSMIIPFQALMIPFVSIYGALEMLNGRLSLIFFYLGFGTALSTFMFRGFISKIPLAIDEAGQLDGASNLHIFWDLILPQLKPIVATVAILNALWIWNDFLLPSLVLYDETRTLPLMTYAFFGQYTSDYGLAMAGLVLSATPIVVFFVFTQRFMVRGITSGAVK
jgi:raffinose/stachyose/melibiose transport system permease protein